MLVIQRVGRLVGHIIDLPVPEAQACLATGSADKPTEKQIAAYNDGGPDALAALDAPESVTEPIAEEEPVAAPEPAPASDEAVAVDLQPDERSSAAADVIAMAQKGSGVPFMTFKAEAAKLLGDDLPAKKNKIIEALKAL